MHIDLMAVLPIQNQVTYKVTILLERNYKPKDEYDMESEIDAKFEYELESTTPPQIPREGEVVALDTPEDNKSSTTEFYSVRKVYHSFSLENTLLTHSITVRAFHAGGY